MPEHPRVLAVFLAAATLSASATARASDPVMDRPPPDDTYQIGPLQLVPLPSFALVDGRIDPAVPGAVRGGRVELAIGPLRLAVTTRAGDDGRLFPRETHIPDDYLLGSLGGEIGVSLGPLAIGIGYAQQVRAMIDAQGAQTVSERVVSLRLAAAF